MLIPTVKPVASVADLYARKRVSLSKLFRQNYYWTGSGSAAIYLAIKSSGAKRVAVPAFTCYIVVDAIRKAGAKPIFYDSGIVATLSDVRKALVEKPDLLIVAYNFGLVPDSDKQILAVCRNAKVPVLEDCAHAFGFGQNADFTIYSSGIAKSVGYYGGFLVSKKPLVLERLPTLRFDKELMFTIKVLLSQIMLNRHSYRFAQKLVKKSIDKYPEAKVYAISRFGKRVVLNQLVRFNQIQKIRSCNFDLVAAVKSVVRTKKRSNLYLVLQTKKREWLIKQLRLRGVEIQPAKSFFNLGGPKYTKATRAEKEHLAFSLYRSEEDMGVVADAIKAVERRL
ncbi:hypothetical protein HOD83_02555 [Candidatus Woesearchaeota archaeon]|jgi:hypothetical protein|nr:hypothetical protein [Candidatus Woesearchaeota archaeon]MBT4114304.1 hypothetical protein [Candidatus Woesearchaeota archaeon]MBT4248448.1 hypothetical protein [Candidatus Woesearchaeota archaeon]